MKNKATRIFVFMSQSWRMMSHRICWERGLLSVDVLWRLLGSPPWSRSRFEFEIINWLVIQVIFSTRFFQKIQRKFFPFSFESIWSKGWIRSIFISQRVIIEQLFGTDHRMLNYKDEDKKVFKPTCNSRLKFESELLYSKISFQTSILFIITNRKS